MSPETEGRGTVSDPEMRVGRKSGLCLIGMVRESWEERGYTMRRPVSSGVGAKKKNQHEIQKSKQRNDR